VHGAVKTKDMASVVRLYYLKNGLKKREEREKARDEQRRSKPCVGLGRHRFLFLGARRAAAEGSAFARGSGGAGA